MAPYNITDILARFKKNNPSLTLNVIQAGSDELENIIDLVAKGMGISLLMKKLAAYLSNPNISIVDISPTISTEISLCYRNNVELSVAAKHFLSCAKLASR